MNIVVYIPTASFYMGGGERVPLMQARFLAEDGHAVSVVTANVGMESDFYSQYKGNLPRNINLTELSPGIDFDGARKAENLSHQDTHVLYFSLIKEISGLLKTARPDCIIVHYSAGMIGLDTEAQKVFILHGVPAQADHVSYSALRFADSVVAVSQSIARGWADKFDYPLKKIAVIHNGIDATLFHPQPEVEKIYDVLYVGRLVDIKGIEYLIRACALLGSKRSIRLAIAGTGPLKAKLQTLATKLGVSVDFLGYIPDAELPQLYAKTTTAVFPSIAKEGVLTTMLEAAASGTPFITSDCCGMTDFAVNEVNSLLVPPANDAALAEAIERLLDDDTLKKTLADQARNDIENQWTWAQAIKPLEQALGA